MKIRIFRLLPALLMLCGIAITTTAQPPTWLVQSDYFGERNAIGQPRTIRGMALSPNDSSVYTGLIQSPNTGSTSLRKVKARVLATPGTDHVIFGNGMPGGTGAFAPVGGQPVYAGGGTGTFEAWRDVDNSPEAIATDDRGHVYVALQSGVSGANKIVIYDSTLSVLLGQFTVSEPTGVAIYKTGGIYYAYTISSTMPIGVGLQRWNVTNPGAPVLDGTWTQPTVKHRNLKVDMDGTVFVAGNNQVRRIAANGSTITHTVTVTNAADLVVFKDKVYVIKRQSPTQSIVVLNKADLTSAGADLAVPAFGASRGDISQFTSIDVSADGRLYVSEENYTGITSGGNSGALLSYTPPVTGFNPTPSAITGRIYFDRVLVSSPVEPAISNVQVTSTTNVTCNGGNNGAATVSFSNGYPPYSYSLDGVNYTVIAGSPFTISGLTANNYTVRVRDGANHKDSTGFIITQPGALALGTCTKTDASCHGTSTGSVSAGSLSNSVGIVSYVWKDSAGNTVGNTPTVNNLPGDTYNLTVTLYQANTVPDFMLIVKVF